jgi:hypothetical protein
MNFAFSSDTHPARGLASHGVGNGCMPLEKRLQRTEAEAALRGTLGDTREKKEPASHTASGQRATPQRDTQGGLGVVEGHGLDQVSGAEHSACAIALERVNGGGRLGLRGADHHELGAERVERFALGEVRQRLNLGDSADAFDNLRVALDGSDLAFGESGDSAARESQLVHGSSGELGLGPRCLALVGLCGVEWEQVGMSQPSVRRNAAMLPVPNGLSAAGFWQVQFPSHFSEAAKAVNQVAVAGDFFRSRSASHTQITHHV